MQDFHTKIPYRSECKMLQHNNVHGLCKTIVWENYMPYYISTVVKPCFILAQYFNIWKGKSISVKSVKTLWPAKKFGLIGNPSGRNAKLFEAKKYLLLIWKQQFFFISLIIIMHFKTKKSTVLGFNSTETNNTSSRIQLCGFCLCLNLSYWLHKGLNKKWLKDRDN